VYLFPLTIFFLLIAVATLGFRARRRWGYRPLALGLTGAAGIVAGKFFMDNAYVGYAGVFLLVAASVWNAWPRNGAIGSPGLHMQS